MVAAWQDKQDLFSMDWVGWKSKNFLKILENFLTFFGQKKAFFTPPVGSKMFPVTFSFLSTPPYGPFGG
jgi:hypothetical protein